MAARKNRPKHDEKTKSKIQASQLINRLMGHIVTYEGSPDFEKKSMTPSQVTAAVSLLKKVMPDLSSTDVKGDIFNHHYVVDSKPMSEKEWSHSYEDNMAATTGATKSIN